MAWPVLGAVCVIFISVTAACAPEPSPSNVSRRTAALPAAAATAAPQHPCSLVTQQAAAAITGDAGVTNQASDVLEPVSGYVACVYTDVDHEANSVSVEIKTVTVGVIPSALRGAATFFEDGEPSQPYTPFPVGGIAESAMGEAIPGAAFVVFATRDRLVYVGARSSAMSAVALRSGVQNLAAHAAAALEAAIEGQP
jgi:hypothetical protein